MSLYQIRLLASANSALTGTRHEGTWAVTGHGSTAVMAACGGRQAGGMWEGGVPATWARHARIHAPTLLPSQGPPLLVAFALSSPGVLLIRHGTWTSNRQPPSSDDGASSIAPAALSPSHALFPAAKTESSLSYASMQRARDSDLGSWCYMCRHRQNGTAATFKLN